MIQGDKLKPGWQVWRFDQIATNVNERIDNPSEADVEYYVGLEHLDPDSLKIRRWGTPSDVEATKLCFRKGDIIFGRRRVYQRKVAVADFDGICSAHALVLRAKPAVVDPGFLPFFMQSDLFMERAKAISVGSLSPTINWKTLAKEEFALPPLEEQRKVSEVLFAVEKTIECYAKAILTAKRNRESVARHLFLADKSVQNTPLKHVIADSRYGPRFSNSLYDDNGELYQLRTSDIDGDGNINYCTIPRVSLSVDKYKEHLLKDGDVVISRSGTCGITAVFRSNNIPTIPAAFLIRLRPNSKMLANYLNEFLSSPVGQQLTSSLARGGVQKNISGSQLLAQDVPCPNIERQKQVVTTLYDLRSTENHLRDRVIYLQELRRILINFILVDSV
ncbi:restriction endonuclease subunit S [Scytonema sp. PCC 10023]|uniref:restriction endonuclease subunit S n=1 Tax=Scytonema sp. PCC 10023 TaxID=1680591 RepID=UPI0039C73BF3